MYFMYIHTGFLIDLGQFHDYRSSNPLGTKGPKRVEFFSVNPTVPFPTEKPTLGSTKPTIPDPLTTKNNQQTIYPKLFNPWLASATRNPGTLGTSVLGSLPFPPPPYFPVFFTASSSNQVCSSGFQLTPSISLKKKIKREFLSLP